MTMRQLLNCQAEINAELKWRNKSKWAAWGQSPTQCHAQCLMFFATHPNPCVSLINSWYARWATIAYASCEQISARMAQWSFSIKKTNLHQKQSSPTMYCWHSLALSFFRGVDSQRSVVRREFGFKSSGFRIVWVSALLTFYQDDMEQDLNK